MAYISQKERATMPASDFGMPAERKFPVRNQDDLDSAVHLVGRAPNPDAVKRRIISIARRKGLSIPKAWQ